MLLIGEIGIRGGICNAVHRFVKANNKYIKDHDEKYLNTIVFHLLGHKEFL